MNIINDWLTILLFFWGILFLFSSFVFSKYNCFLNVFISWYEKQLKAESKWTALQKESLSQSKAIFIKKQSWINPKVLNWFFYWTCIITLYFFGVLFLYSFGWVKILPTLYSIYVPTGIFSWVIFCLPLTLCIMCSFCYQFYYILFNFYILPFFVKEKKDLPVSNKIEEEKTELQTTKSKGQQIIVAGIFEYIDHVEHLWDINFTFLVFILPLISLLILLVIWNINKNVVYDISLFLSSLSFVFSFFLIFVFDSTKSGFQFSCILDLMPSLLYSLHLGIDGISIFFILLTYLFIFFCILSLNPTAMPAPRIKEAIFHLFFLQWTVTASFLFVDLLGFFLFFEMTLIPIYFLVLGWGSRERRIRASYLISLYTMFGSIFLFFNILYLYSKTGTTNYELLLTFELNKEDQIFLWITFFLSFAAKIPVFPLHIWLPEAHVEAPTIGSVLLAALLLKIGTYGLIRFSLPLLPEGTLSFSGIVSLIAILGIIYTSLTAIRQIDLKKIIAYSSVGHMNVVLLGIISESSEGVQGAIFQMLSHGIVAGALFFAVGSLYERYTVRSLKYFGGLTYFYPLLSTVFLTFFLANISFPLTSSFIGEFLIFMGFFKQSFWGTFFASTSMVLGAIYTLWTYNRIFFGNVRILSVSYFKDLTKKEMSLFFLLIIILFIMGLRPNIFLDVFLIDVLNLLESSKH